MSDLDTKFKQAQDQSRKLTKLPTQQELLLIYAYFKQGEQKPPISEAKAPGPFDFAGKKKRQAWQAVSDLSSEQSKKKYVALVEEMKTKYGYDANKKPE